MYGFFHSSTFHNSQQQLIMRNSLSGVVVGGPLHGNMLFRQRSNIQLYAVFYDKMFGSYHRFVDIRGFVNQYCFKLSFHDYLYVDKDPNQYML